MLLVVTVIDLLALSHCAIEWPCHVRSAGGDDGVKCSARVCMPASLSTPSVLSSSHATWNRPGTRMMAAAPNALHWFPAASSAAGFHASAVFLPSALSGTRV